MKLAVLSISGGLDSTCLLLKLLSEGYTVKCYSFDYGQKHIIEQHKLSQNMSFLCGKGFPVELQCIDLKDCFSDSQSSLHQNGEAIPEGHYADESMKSTVVENRNVIFASIVYGKALSLAKKYNCEVEIFLGIHAGDHAIYPDCTEESRYACEHAFQISNWGSDRVTYQAPFIGIDKGHVLKEGLEALYNLDLKPSESSMVLKNTHTCYNPDEEGRSCGKCGSCTERLEAFAFNNMIDPTEYQKGYLKRENFLKKAR